MDDSLSQTAGERIDSLRGLDEKSEQPDNDGSVGLADAIRQKAGLDTKVWVPYQGPEGGEGWQDLDGNVRYTSDAPGDTLDPADLDADDVADMSDEEFDTLLESVATVTDDPGGFAEDLAGEVGMDTREEGVVDAVKDDPDAIRRAAEGRGADLGGDGGGGGAPSPTETTEMLIDMNDNTVTAVGESLGIEAASDPSEVASNMDGSARSALVDEGPMAAVAEAGGTPTPMLAADAMTDYSDEDISEVAGAIGMPDEDDPSELAANMTGEQREALAEGGPDALGGDGGDGGSGDTLDDEELSSAVEDAFEESGADDPAAFSEDVMNELGYGTRDSIEGEGVTEADVQEAVDSVTGGGGGGGGDGGDGGTAGFDADFEEGDTISISDDAGNERNVKVEDVGEDGVRVDLDTGTYGDSDVRNLDPDEWSVDENVSADEKAEAGDIDHSEVYGMVADAYGVTPAEAEEALHDAFGVEDEKSGGPDTDEKADFGDDSGASLIEKARASTGKRYQTE